MPFRPARFAVSLVLTGMVSAAETDRAGSAAPASPLRQYLRESLKAQLSAKSSDAATPPEPKSADAPVLLPAFRVQERSAARAVEKVTAALAQEDRLSLHPLLKTDLTPRLRLEVLHRPVLEPGPQGTPRLKLDIFQLKW